MVEGQHVVLQRNARSSAACISRGCPQSFVAKPRCRDRRIRSVCIPTAIAERVMPKAASLSDVSHASRGVTKQDHPKFVSFFRSASAYIEGHRGKTFVVVIPGEVVMDTAVLNSVLQDVAILHGLGVKLVLVVGAGAQIDNALRDRGREPVFFGGCRVTDEEAMAAAMEAAGATRMALEAMLSRGPKVSMVRRHARTSSEFHYVPAVCVVSGNYVAAKRRGIVDGVDFAYSGDVRWVNCDAIRNQLDAGNVVLLGNLGYSAVGELLNCSVYDVGTSTAVGLGADKLFCLHMDDVRAPLLPAWLPLADAEALVSTCSTLSCNNAQQTDVPAMAVNGSIHGAMATTAQHSPQGLYGAEHRPPLPPSSRQNGSHTNHNNGSHDSFQNGASAAAGHSSSANGNGATAQHAVQSDKATLPKHMWMEQGITQALLSCCAACRQGVTRSHLVDARLDGVLLLELYTRDGAGTMISTDFYEGIRHASPNDVVAIEALLQPLIEQGIVVARTRQQLLDAIGSFVVVEREARVLACAQLRVLGRNDAGAHVAELGAFCVHPDFRGSGRGDSLVDFIEQEARNLRVDLLVLLTTRTADWFIARDFVPAGAAHASDVLPQSRRVAIDPRRNSQLYVKVLEPAAGDPAPAGKRIGF